MNSLYAANRRDYSHAGIAGTLNRVMAIARMDCAPLRDWLPIRILSTDGSVCPPQNAGDSIYLGDDANCVTNDLDKSDAGTPSPDDSDEWSNPERLEWVSRAKRGDHQSFANLVDASQQSVGRAMWRFTRNRSEWELLVQDVFVEAYLSLKSLRSPDKFGGWLKTVAVRVGYRFWKSQDRSRNRRTETIEDWTDIAAPNRDINAAEAAEVVHHVLAQLPPRDRLVLTLHYLDELSTAEIGERCEWSRTMVKVQLHRARKKLERILQAAESEEAHRVRAETKS